VKPIAVVTGSSGLIGSEVARRLARDHTVVGFDITEPPAHAPIDLSLYMDVTADMSVRDVVDRILLEYGRRIAAVVHLSAYYDFSGKASPRYRQVTVEGTRRILEELRRKDVDVERFIFASTMLVHAPVRPGERLDEESPLDPRWAYPQSKLETERVICQARGGYPATMLRIAGVYTDRGRQPTLVHQIKRIHGQDFNSFFFPGDSEAGQSLVHLDCAVDAIVRTVERRRNLPDEVAILIGEPDPVSYAELQDLIGERLWGDEWPTLRVPEPMAKAGAWIQDKVPGSDGFIKPYMIELADDHYALDISRARELLGWAPRRSLRDVLPRILDDLLEDPARWYRRNDLEPPGRVARSFD